MWAASTDDGGNIFYYHLRTRESSWDLPPDVSQHAAMEAAAQGAATRVLVNASLWERIGRAFRTWSSAVRWVRTAHLLARGTIVPRIARALEAWMTKRDQAHRLVAHNRDLLEDLAIARLSVQHLESELARARLKHAEAEFVRLQSGARLRRP